MPQLRLICFTSLLTGLGALAGVLVGRQFGPRTTMLAAMAGGTMALLWSLRIAAVRGWLDPQRSRGGAIGGLVGLGLATPLAVMTADHPAALIAAAALVGVGVVLGGGPGAAR